MNVTGIILIAGNSTRFGKNTNKNFEKINNKYIFEYSLMQFSNSNLINDIIIAVKEEEKDFVKEIIKPYEKQKNIKIVVGGKTRRESVYNCLIKTKSDIVIIHDGARPLIKQEYIIKCIEEMNRYEGTAIAVKTKDTIKISDDNGIVINTTERKNTWIIQTPQCFNRKVLLEAHKKNKEEDKITDDCMLLEQIGRKVKLIEGNYTNIKVTTRRGYKFGKRILKSKINLGIFPKFTGAFFIS